MHIDTDRDNQERVLTKEQRDNIAEMRKRIAVFPHEDTWVFESSPRRIAKDGSSLVVSVEECSVLINFTAHVGKARIAIASPYHIGRGSFGICKIRDRSSIVRKVDDDGRVDYVTTHSRIAIVTQLAKDAGFSPGMPVVVAMSPWKDAGTKNIPTPGGTLVEVSDIFRYSPSTCYARIKAFDNAVHPMVGDSVSCTMTRYMADPGPSVNFTATVREMSKVAAVCIAKAASDLDLQDGEFYILAVRRVPRDSR